MFLGRLFGDVVLQTIGDHRGGARARIALGALLYDVFADGWGRLNWQFLTSFPSRRPAEAGIYPALIGTMYLIGLTTILALPVGVAAAIYLEEYGKGNWLARIIEINIANLAGVPSIIYGLLGLGLFVRTLGFGRSVLAGAATMALLVLPIVILSTREALRTVPKSIREGSYALGATKWQTIWHQVLPSAMPEPLHRSHSGVVARDWRDRAAHHDRRAHLRAVRARQHLVAFYRAADSDLRLAVPSAGRVFRERRGRHHRPARASPRDERRRDILPRSLSAAREKTAQHEKLCFSALCVLCGEKITNPPASPVVHAKPEYAPPSLARSSMSAHCNPVCSFSLWP